VVFDTRPPLPICALAAEIFEILQKILQKELLAGSGTPASLWNNVNLSARLMPGSGADLALAELERTENRWYEAEIHRIRAEILLKHDPADTAAAEQSLQAAIAIAQSQKARSFELRAALSLAKLYRAGNRDADAHAVLAPAVEGFPPTQQFPELTEAQALLAALNP
jgi:predicted negative regulator of RcsB-dependent stress response